MVSSLHGTNDPRVITRRDSTLPFKKCKFVNASNGGVKICSLSPPAPLAPPSCLWRALARAPYYLRLLSNTKNQIKYAKLRFEDFGESKLPRGRRNIFFTPSVCPRAPATSTPVYYSRVVVSPSPINFQQAVTMRRRCESFLAIYSYVARPTLAEGNSVFRLDCFDCQPRVSPNRFFTFRRGGASVYIIYLRTGRDIDSAREKFSFRFTRERKSATNA